MTRLKPLLLTLSLLGACGPSAPPALHRQIDAGFRSYLARRAGNPAAERTRAFLDGRPGIRPSVDWTPEEGGSWGEWKQDKLEISLSSEPFVAYGLLSSSRTLPADRLDDYLRRYGAVMVHELSHARTDGALPFFLSGNFENEAVAWAEQASFQRAEGLLSDPGAARGGRIWAEELAPMTERLDLLADRIIAVASVGTAASKREHKRLYAEHLRMKKSHAAIRSRVERAAPGKSDYELQMLGVTAAFDRGCPSLRALVRIFHPQKPSLLAPSEELADLGRREKLMSDTCPRVEDSAERASCERTLASIRRSRDFWSDPEKVGAARRDYEARWEAVCADRVRPARQGADARR